MQYKKITLSTSSKKPHDFIGSKIRGILGYALKKEVCINPTLECTNCFAQDECIFYKFYEAKNITHKYRFDFELENKNFEFSLYLFDDAIASSNDVKNALLNAMREFESVQCTEELVTFTMPKAATVIKIEFLTPLRIKKGNKFARKDIELIDLLSSINRRYYELHNEAFQRLNISKEYQCVLKHLAYKELTRKSNTQKTKMNLGGLIGEMIVSNVDEKSYKLLKIGEIIGVGKSSVFGNGKIKITEIA